MKTLRIALTVALSISLFGPAYAGGGKGGGGGGGKGGGGGGGKGGGGSRGGGGGGGGIRIGGSGGGGIRIGGSGIRIGGSGGSGIRIGGFGGGSKGGSSRAASLAKSIDKFRIVFGRARCYHAPVVVVSSPAVLFAPEPVPAEEIASGGTVELPGDWGREGGYACLMQGEKYVYFKILEWTAKGVKLEVPRLDIKEPIEATLLMVRSDRYTYPEIPVIVYPPLPASADAVAGAAKTEGKAAEGPTATVAKTEQAAQATPAADAAPPEIDGEGTFEQLERSTTDGDAGAKTK